MTRSQIRRSNLDAGTIATPRSTWQHRCSLFHWEIYPSVNPPPSLARRQPGSTLGPRPSQWRSLAPRDRLGTNLDTPWTWWPIVLSKRRKDSSTKSDRRASISCLKESMCRWGDENEVWTLTYIFSVPYFTCLYIYIYIYIYGVCIFTGIAPVFVTNSSSFDKIHRQTKPPCGHKWRRTHWVQIPHGKPGE